MSAAAVPPESLAFAILTAAFASSVAIFLSARCADAIRNEAYRRRDEARKGLIGSLLPHSKAPREEVVRPLVRELHQGANATQTSYYRYAAATVSSIFLAYAALAVGIAFGHQNEAWNALLLTVEFTSLAIATILATIARSLNSEWLEKRAKAEFARQFATLLGLMREPPPEGRTASFFRAADQVNKLVRGQRGEALDDAIRKVWATRSADLASSNITGDAFAAYVDERARRQLAWFQASRQSLEVGGRVVRYVVLVLFSVSALGVSVKVLFLLLGWHNASSFETLLELVLLLSTGAAGGLAALQQGQNSRSILHVYAFEERRIKTWLQAATTNLHDATAYPKLVVEFEGDMIEELITWTQITRESTIELSP